MSLYARICPAGVFSQCMAQSVAADIGLPSIQCDFGQISDKALKATTDGSLRLQNVLSCYRMCSLTVEGHYGWFVTPVGHIRTC